MNRMPSPGFRGSVLLLMLYAAVLSALPWRLPKAQLLALFAENGPVENLSVIAWLLLALLCLLQVLRWPRLMLPAMLTALLGAAREQDLQNAITGVNLFRLKWYLTADTPLGLKLVASVTLMLIVALLLHMLLLAAQAYRQRDTWRQQWAWTLLLALAVAAASLGLDKTQALVHDATGHWLHERASLWVKALEEGLELALPLVFASALLQARRMRRSAW